MQDFDLPRAEYGMTRTHFCVGRMPDNLPQRDALVAANALNEMRYRGLTTKQRLFVDCYLANNYDGAAAALEARLTTDPVEALALAGRMLKNKKIKETIALAQIYFTEKSKFRFDADRHLQDLDDIASANVMDFITEDSFGDHQIVLPDDRSKTKAIQSIKVRKIREGKGRDAITGTEIEIKFYSAIDAKKELFRLCGYQPAMEITAKEAVEIAASAARPITFNIVGVPTGEFIPAPEPPHMQTIEHQIAATA